MDMATAKTLVKDLLGERGSYWPDAQLTRLVNQANRLVYRAICQADPSYFLTKAVATYPAEGEIDLTATLGANPYRVSGVSKLKESAVPSSTNTPMALEYVDIHQDAEPGVKANDPNYQEWGGFSPPRWTLLQDKLQLIPIPSEAVYLYIAYIAHPTTLSAGANPLLEGKCLEYEDLVVATCVKLCQSKERGGGVDAEGLYQWIKDEVRGAERTGRTDHSKIIYESPY